MTTSNPIDDLDIVAYVDNELDDARTQEVESWLATHPEDAAKVHAYKLQNLLLRSLHDDVRTEPLPAPIEAAVASPARPFLRQHWMKIAATFLVVAVSSLAGWHLHDYQSGVEGTERKFVERAFEEHVVFVSGGPGVEETSIARDERLRDVYTRHFNHPLTVPDLAGAGFVPTGRRLLHDKGVPTAQFMYKDPAGRMVTLYIQGGFDRSDMTFRLIAEDNMVAFYWTDGPLGYALTGSMKRGDLLDLARMVYEKLPGQKALTN